MTLNHESSESQTLLLIPVKMELDWVVNHVEIACRIHACGFGPIAAGVETCRLLAGSDFQRVILFGIAGTYDSHKLPVGAACVFQRVGCFGIGAGNGADFQTTSELGYADSDELPLKVPALVDATQDMLLTVTSAAANQEQVALRREKFPDAIAEDMEAFSVAMAASRFDRVVTVIRGISNIAGNRDRSTWKIETAMKAAADLLNSVIPD